MAVVVAHTDIPVPTGHGAVDEHPAFRAPFFLMDAMAGRTPPMTSLAERSSEATRSIGRQTGAYAAQLHAIEVPGLSRFGTGLTHDDERPLHGEPPTGDPRRTGRPTARRPMARTAPGLD